MLSRGQGIELCFGQNLSLIVFLHLLYLFNFDLDGRFWFLDAAFASWVDNLHQDLAFENDVTFVGVLPNFINCFSSFHNFISCIITNFHQVLPGQALSLLEEDFLGKQWDQVLLSIFRIPLVIILCFECGNDMPESIIVTTNKCSVILQLFDRLLHQALIATQLR